jgi:FMN-dependent oxidoreductase (nitrilotriacetate monooxygenase family)
MKIGVMFDHVGIHPAAWLDPGTPLGGEVSLSLYAQLARTAETAKLDFVFRADSPSSREGNLEATARYPSYVAEFEPITLLSALAAVTSQIGLAGTASTSYFEPYNLARQFASLDHLSGGRAAWNVVTSASPLAALNFGQNAQEEHGRRYARANEFVDVVNGLWDSWEDDAFVRDRRTGIFFDASKRRPLNHRGEFYSVKGPLNIHRSPQGRPVIISAGGSEPGMELAARTSDVVFSVDMDFESAKSTYQNLKGRLAKYGRSPDDLKVLTALNPYVGRSDEEGRKKLDALQSLIHPSVGREILAVDLAIDLKHLPLDEPIPLDLLPNTSNRTKSYFDNMVAVIRDRRLTVRQLYLACAASRGGMNAIAGSPTTIADRMERWFRGAAADGFMVRLAQLPGSLDDFTTLVIPELQRRGLFRIEYDGSMLRDHLGLARPTNNKPKE